MRPEAELLLELVTDRAPRATESGRSVDANALLELARAHQVAALAYQRWRNGAAAGKGGADLPAEVRPAFRLTYLHHAMRNEVLQYNLADIADALARRGVPAVVFKGPWLAFRAYPDPGARPVDDIDLGVHERDYAGALEALASLDYRSDAPPPPGPEEALRRAHYGRQLRFTCRGRRPLELHFRMVNLGPPGGEERWLWERVRTLEVDGRTIQVPGPEAMLAHVLLHSNQHGFALLRLLFDVRYALEESRDCLDADAFLALVRAQRLRATAYHGLLLARDLAGAAVPHELLAALRPGPLERRRFDWLWSLGDVRRLEVRRRALEVESPRFYLLEMGRLRDKARYLASVVREAGGPLNFLRAWWRVAPSR